MNNRAKAEMFGSTLDNDQFDLMQKLLSDDCKYFIGNKVLTGPEEICNSYKQNMIEGRKKLDKLEWGDSMIEELDENTFIVHFTDYLSHKDITHIHRCKQRLNLNEASLICKITHLDNHEEENSLKEFYRSVGIV